MAWYVHVFTGDFLLGIFTGDLVGEYVMWLRYVSRINNLHFYELHSLFRRFTTNISLKTEGGGGIVE